MKKLLALMLGAVAFTAPAAAQPVPQVGVTFGYIAKVTYSAGFIGLVPAAATTDLICIAGSATKTVKLQTLKISGSGTAISVPATLLKRVSADTGGTAASTTANPANNISKRDSGNQTATATVIAYTANPTIVDTTPSYIDSANLGVVATTVGVVNAPIVFDYDKDGVNLRQAPTLKGVAEQICLNLNATTATALLSGAITWTEE